MSSLNRITPLILTYNEAPNIERTLSKLTWAEEIVIIDSGSTDGTLDLVSRYSNTRIVHRDFDSFAGQCNFGMQFIKTDWVLSIDADYVISEELIAEMGKLTLDPPYCGYKAAFRYCIEGIPLRACLYPPRTVLHRVQGSQYLTDGHAHRVQVSGEAPMLSGRIDHDDRKPLSRWFASQDKYARLEAEKLSQQTELSLQDRIRQSLILGPIIVFLYTLVVKMTFLDGWAGWYYTFQRTLAEIMLSLRLLEKRIGIRAGNE